MGIIDETIAAVKASYSQIEGVEAVLGRPLKAVDPKISMSIYSVDWIPAGAMIGQSDPATATYTFRSQTMVKHSNEEEGRALHTQLSKIARIMLYRDPSLVATLRGLSESSMGSIERFQKYGVRTQRFLNNELQGNFVFLATIEWWLETEITQL